MNGLPPLRVRGPSRLRLEPSCQWGKNYERTRCPALFLPSLWAPTPPAVHIAQTIIW